MVTSSDIPACVTPDELTLIATWWYIQGNDAAIIRLSSTCQSFLTHMSTQARAISNLR